MFVWQYLSAVRFKHSIPATMVVVYRFYNMNNHLCAGRATTSCCRQPITFLNDRDWQLRAPASSSTSPAWPSTPAPPAWTPSCFPAWSRQAPAEYTLLSDGVVAICGAMAGCQLLPSHSCISEAIVHRDDALLEGIGVCLRSCKHPTSGLWVKVHCRGRLASECRVQVQLHT